MTSSSNNSPSGIAHFQGGRRQNNTTNTMTNTEENDLEARVEHTNTTNNNNNNVVNNNNNNNRRGTSFDDDLPEGIDVSEGGWATDFALALVATLFFISGLHNYNDNNHQRQRHFLYLHAGTAVAHAFGGLAHRFYPNRAIDGEGQIGFYLTMVPGYGGNCLRYSMGWDLDGAYWPALGAVNFAYLVVTAAYTVCRMTKTNLRIDTSEGTGFLPDRLYAAGEVVVALLEVVAGLVFLWEKDIVGAGGTITATNAFAVTAVVSNIIGWAAVYLVGGLVFCTGKDYNPALMQRIFHYALMVMVWAVHEYANAAAAAAADSSLIQQN